jgi:glycosyltransferase involved in cell wall biosynthesis
MHDLSGGGVERQCLTLARELRFSGLTVTLVLHRARGELLDQIPVGIRVVDLHSRRTLHDIPLLARWLCRERPDILLANVDHNNIAALLAKALSGGRTRLVICQHNTLSADFFGREAWTYRLVPAADRLLSPFAAGVVAVSEGIAKDLVANAGMPGRKVVKIPNAVVGPEFADKAAEPVSHPWLDRRGPPVFVTAGRLVAQKDHATLLRAFALHLEQGPARLIILGSGPLRAELDALCRELGISEVVDFVGFRDNPLPWFRRADAFVLSSRSEGFGNVLVEAMACGTPAIATNCPYGPAEILENGKYGLLVPPENPHALAKAMGGVALLRARWPCDVLQERAAAFSHSACAAAYVGLFQTLLPWREAPA